MDIKVIILGILALFSAIATCALLIVDTRDKRKNIWIFKVAEIKRYMAFISLFLAVVTIMLQIKSQIDDKLEAVERQSVILKNLTKLIINTDPISESSLFVGWSCDDSLVYKYLREYFEIKREKHRNCISVEEGYYEYDYTIGDSCNKDFYPFFVNAIYFIDSNDYKSNKDKLFALEKISGDYRETKLLETLSKFRLLVDRESVKSTIFRHSESKDGDGFGDDEDRFSGLCQYPIITNFNNDDVFSFSSLKDLYCLILIDRSLNVDVGGLQLRNNNLTKTVSLNCKKIFPTNSKFLRAHEEIYLSTKNKLTFK